MTAYVSAKLKGKKVFGRKTSLEKVRKFCQKLLEKFTLTKFY